MDINEHRPFHPLPSQSAFLLVHQSLGTWCLVQDRRREPKENWLSYSTL